MSFEEWLIEVNKHLARITGGLTTDCIIDAPYRDWYEGGVSPRQAAKDAWRNEREG